ncbi:MAG: hypothetical protein AAF485_02885 [Chloroflexota bacterium]
MSNSIPELRAKLLAVREQLIDAEADLADRLAEVNAFELEFEVRVGYLIDQLDALDQEIYRYNEQIMLLRNKDSLGNAYIPVEAQYRRRWQTPPRKAPTPPPTPLPPQDEKTIKQLYRQLARRFHPDLATDEADRRFRTQKMAAINDAYAARSLAELNAIAAEDEQIITPNQRSKQIDQETEAQMMAALKAELARYQRRLREIEREIRNLPQRSSVKLSIEVKAARQKGKDLLNELATEYEQKVARKTAVRDMIKAQFDQLGPDQGFIQIKR